MSLCYLCPFSYQLAQTLPCIMLTTLHSTIVVQSLLEPCLSCCPSLAAAQGSQRRGAFPLQMYTALPTVSVKSIIQTQSRANFRDSKNLI